MEQQKLINAGKALEDCLTLSTYKIRNENFLHLIVKPRDEIGIAVRTYDGETIFERKCFRYR